ncbi:GNAT family N-acetyltransferase [Spirosoma sp. HMF3257]|uniref:GNAT family N-acetyltransferase n=1 Tax=Spirosoma telluris TaxID=2183553 RepID=A0A327NYU3_9BACT|nr:GNAT family N-acetyltransferase [Spirosoma telluris]RAI78038.1 hypothetical protein HMF3257_35200 [Spirosoma telluris]
MNTTSNLISKNGNDYRIERVNNSLFPSIAALVNAASKAKFTGDFLQKKYATQFLGSQNVGYTAFDGDLAVSHQMGLLIELRHKDITYLAIQSCDSATHPDYAKKGLWAILNDYMFRQAQLEHVTGVLGLPNQNSYSIGINKLGYNAGGIFINYSIKVTKVPVGRIVNKLGFRKWTAHHAEKSFKKYKIPPVSFSSFDTDIYLAVNRTTDYLEYKQRLGSFFIQVYSTVFWVKIRSQNLFIGDLKTTSELEFRQAMNKLKSICYWAGLESIIFQTQKGSFEESLFEKYYLSIETMPILYKVFDKKVPFHLLKYTYADLDTF